MPYVACCACGRESTGLHSIPLRDRGWRHVEGDGWTCPECMNSAKTNNPEEHTMATPGKPPCSSKMAKDSKSKPKAAPMKAAKKAKKK